MKHLLLTLIAFSFLLIVNSETFSQTTGKKRLVKCYKKGKIVYRTKCRPKKHHSRLKPILKPQKIKIAPYGDPNSKFDLLSNGTGSGGGQGTGSGRGQGIGNGTGNGSGVNKEEPVLPPSTTNKNGDSPLKLLFKPKGEYNDKARQDQVQGTVRLRVTFLANGNIGAISPVQGLPDGLTAAAIEAAKRIRFQPAIKNGKPVTVTKMVEYTFTLY